MGILGNYLGMLLVLSVCLANSVGQNTTVNTAEGTTNLIQSTATAPPQTTTLTTTTTNQTTTVTVVSNTSTVATTNTTTTSSINSTTLSSSRSSNINTTSPSPSTTKLNSTITNTSNSTISTITSLPSSTMSNSTISTQAPSTNITVSSGTMASSLNTTMSSSTISTNAPSANTTISSTMVSSIIMSSLPTTSLVLSTSITNTPTQGTATTTITTSNNTTSNRTVTTKMASSSSNTTLPTTVAETTTIATTSTLATTTEMDPCTPNPCKNGVCERLVNNSEHMCLCHPGWTGPSCAEDIDECLECTGAGRYCINKPGSHECGCKSGYVETDSGSCSDVKDKFVYPVRVTLPEITGLNLTWKDGLTNSSTAEYKQVKNITLMLLNIAYPPSHYTVLINGFSKKDSRKRASASPIIVDFVVISNKQENDTTLSTTIENACKMSCNISYEGSSGSFSFLTGSRIIQYSGTACKTYYDPCDSKNSVCNVTDGKVRCDCKDGYEPFEEKLGIVFSCKDKNECDSKPCSTNATCLNEIGGFSCSCKENYFGEKTKNKKDACAGVCEGNRCGEHGKCSTVKENPNAFLCKCDTGYTGLTCNEDDPEFSKLRSIVIAVGSSLGVIVIILFLATIISCCNTRKQKKEGFEITSAFESGPIDDSWGGKIPRPSVSHRYNDVHVYDESEELMHPSSTKPTTFGGGKKDNVQMDSYLNAAFDGIDLEENEYTDTPHANGVSSKQTRKPIKQNYF